MENTNILTVDNEIISAANITELHLVNAACIREFTDDGYFYLYALVKPHPAKEFCGEIQTKWSDESVIRDYIKWFCPDCKCVKIAILYSKPNYNLSEDKCWKNIWENILEQATNISKKIEKMRNNFFKSITKFY